tara:strand:- start:2062 stop:2415 length:354 start_codon:yes stop_codon:yes gene_type:complete
MEAFLFSLALSTHIGLEADYNNLHPHLRLYEDGAIAGIYYNSVENFSLYGGYRFEKDPFGLEVAIVTGYPAFGEVAPYLRGTMDIGKSSRIFMAPAYETDNNNNINIGIVGGIEFIF